MPFRECEISDMLRGRAKAWQVPRLASWTGFLETKLSLEGWGGRLRGGSLLLMTAGRKFEENRKVLKTTMVRCMGLNYLGFRKRLGGQVLGLRCAGPLGGPSPDLVTKSHF